MNYLKCDSCKQYNLLTSEYLVFCNHCSKKLSNNFADWKARYPQCDFAQFTERIAISAAQIASSRPLMERLKTGAKQRWVKHRRQLVMTSFLLLAMIAITGSIFGKRLVFNLFYPKVAKEWQYMSWQETTIGRQPITLSTPAKLRVHDTPLPPELRESVTYSKSYTNDNNSGMDISVHLYTYKNSVINSLEAMANNPVDPLSQLKQQDDITHLTARAQKVSVSDLAGCLEEGTYHYKGAITLAYRHLILIREQDMWQVNLVFRADDEAASAVAERVLRSIHIQ
ncbi:hypothetical protein DCC81_11095 [Chitinophaga parva]|uniref:Uncharacterized protein n=1 Tax=Chitinophaga parva TaxID=2169414 RepID=A0A2T7BF10_9BACT|nr:hypothetical protein [Chitinophaga parva]PUZ24865.1 hypothetical protein DCC81_11095 [Chitinophaga parva]